MTGSPKDGDKFAPGMQHQLTRMLEWMLATAGVMICVAGAITIAAQQQQMSSPGESLWPLPGLVLAEWLLLGLAGLAGIVLDRQRANFPWSTVAWAACGGLVALMIVGALSIGPLVLIALLALGGAATAANLRKKRSIWAGLRTLSVGALANFVLLFILIATFGS